ncbi:IS21-like element helper ATPase IstB [Aquisalimonas sp.]|uniref:IS21-like element helper ATPase IstB n=1 Tax=Aquisalimonas sp. TaxID=1872621 RepID=UPI0025BCD7E0|nr:IS21-like element helper ATPase IstB [Aquisalimonas sp.]
MLMQQTLDTLHALRLPGMAQALQQQLEQPATHELCFEERLALLVERELLVRDNRRLSRLLKAARLRLAGACIEDIDYRHPRGLKRAQIAGLASGEWLRAGHNLCLSGPTGTGKTYLACALGNQACRLGFSVRYFRLPRLLEQLAIAHGDGSYPRLMASLAKADLLLLDDWAIQPLTAGQRHDLMELIEDRHGLKSTLIASQLPIEHWHDYLGEPTVADAILDRLLHRAHRIPLQGESLRKSSPAPEQGNGTGAGHA